MEANFSKSGTVFGCNSAGEANESYCLGCVASEEDIPFANVALGAFFLGDHFDEPSIVNYCAALAKSKKSGKLIVLQCNSELTTLVYDIKSKSLGQCSSQIVDFKEAMANLVNISLSYTFHLKCTYYSENFKESVQSFFQEIKQNITETLFQLDGSAYQLSDDPDQDLLVEDLYNQIENFDDLADVQMPANMKKKMIEKLQRKLKTDKQTLEFVASGSTKIEKLKTATTSIELQEGTLIDETVPIKISYSLQLANQVTYLYKTFISSLTKVLSQIESSLLASVAESSVLQMPVVFNFYDPSNFSHNIAAVYSNTTDENAFKEQRKRIHSKYIVPFEKPTFKSINQVDAKLTKDNNLLNVHVGLNSGIKNGNPVTVSGKYLYFHYNQNQMNDSGWGCAYRSLQTIISWFQLQGYLDIDRVANHQQIQQALVDVGDKPASFVGSSKWIGSQEVCYVLNQLYGFSSKIIFINSGAELANKARELIQHFQNNGTPIMIGGGVLAHTIIGVHFDETNGDVRYLVLDPHYTGVDDISVIHKKVCFPFYFVYIFHSSLSTQGWVGWKKVDFWDKNSFYNLCLPQKPIDF